MSEAVMVRLRGHLEGSHLQQPQRWLLAPLLDLSGELAQSLSLLGQLGDIVAELGGCSLLLLLELPLELLLLFVQEVMQLFKLLLNPLSLSGNRIL